MLVTPSLSICSPDFEPKWIFLRANIFVGSHR